MTGEEVKQSIKRTERGWAGHFVASDSCLFRRNTLLEYEGIKIVISTVGKLVSGRKIIEVGSGRYYETMAFFSDSNYEYDDADVSWQVYFDSEWAINSLKNLSDLQANEMHEEVVKEISQKLLSGYFLEF